MKTIQMVDLFAGAGGTSTGAQQAAEAAGVRLQLAAVNHWDVAIATHKANHPRMAHVCASTDDLMPRQLVPGGKLDILWASPECTHHSKAHGGRPKNAQSRATAWCVVRWAEQLHPEVILVENVEEFEDWGPLDPQGLPIKEAKGQIFQAWVAAIRALGYRVDWRVLRAADYGDPTIRQRLFVQATRGSRPIRWPEPTHDEHGAEGKPQWPAFREHVNWKHKIQSVFTRKRPLAAATLRRIGIGLARFGFRPFLVPQQQGHVCRDLQQPLPTVTSRGAEALCAPAFLTKFYGTGVAAGLEDPIDTVTTKARFGLGLPYLVMFANGSPKNDGTAAVSLERPLRAVVGQPEYGVTAPYLVHLRGTGTAVSLDEPCRTVTAGGCHQGLVVCPPEPLAALQIVEDAPEQVIVEAFQRAVEKEQQRTKQAFTPLELAIVEVPGGRRYLQVTSPLHGTMLFDVMFRMLQPDELAAGQGFPANYRFTGTKGAAYRQIGNAVPPGLSRALVAAQLPFL